jgi:hypothetical protein
MRDAFNLPKQSPDYFFLLLDFLPIAGSVRMMHLDTRFSQVIAENAQ